MLSTKKCIVESCQNLYHPTKDNKLCFYALPSTNLPLLQQWLLKIKLTTNPVFQKICSAHFDESCFVKHDTSSSSMSNGCTSVASQSTSSLILKSDAVPTLFLDNPFLQKTSPMKNVILKTEVIDNSSVSNTINHAKSAVSKTPSVIISKTKIAKKPSVNKKAISAKHTTQPKPGSSDSVKSVLQLKCNNCGFETPKQKKMAKHIRYEHITISLKPRRLVPKPSISSQCNHCCFKAKKKSLMKKHLVTMHSPDKPWTCNFCPFAARTELTLNMHISRRHKYEKKYECGLCRKYSSASKSAIKCHILKKHFDSSKLL